MGLGKIGRIGAGLMTLGGTEIVGVGDDIEGFGNDPTGANAAEERLNAYLGNTAAQRARAKKMQYDLLGQMKAPTVSPQQEARIKALESESNLSLIEDPNFQSPMRQATSGGARALSSIQNRQAASGAEGGFANQGSISDVYDRVGGQLSEIAQQQNQFKEQKRDAAAEARQGIADAQIAYDNAITQAKIAIEAGDASAAQNAMAQAYQAREAIQNRKTQLIMGVAGLGVSALTANPAGAASSAQQISGSQAQPTAIQGNYAGQDLFQSGTGGQTYQPHYKSRSWS